MLAFEHFWVNRIMDIQIIAGVGLFVFGVVLGAVLQRSFAGGSGKNKRLEQKLAETQEAYTKYQAEVSTHFMDTARKVQNLNNSYRDVHEQLARGASRLCSDDEANDFLSISLDQTTKGKVYDDSDSSIPPMPMDYAPKEKPDEEGTLSEKFGLKENGIAKEVTGSNTDSVQSEPQNDESETLANAEPSRI
jgi:uncharacterized protein